MPVTIKVNGTNLSLVHKFSNGISTATVPDVCKTPTPGGPVPMPYPNIAQSITLSNGTTTVKGDKAMAANKGSKFALSNGDQPGTIGGIKSNVFMKEATWILYSFDVKLNKKNACRFTDPMFHNAENTVNLGGELQPIVIQQFEDLLKSCIDKASTEWENRHGRPDYKVFCKSRTNRTRRGDQIGTLAMDCVQGEMNNRGRSNEVAIDQSYDRNGPGGTPQALGGRGDIIPNTSRPDVVLHMPGQINSVRAVYDFKAPCPPGSNVPGWARNQGADYISVFKVVPKLVSPGNRIVTGARLIGAGAKALAKAAKLLRIPLPWP
jgi:hypothetical protein